MPSCEAFSQLLVYTDKIENWNATWSNLWPVGGKFEWGLHCMFTQVQIHKLLWLFWTVIVQWKVLPELPMIKWGIIITVLSWVISKKCVINIYQHHQWLISGSTCHALNWYAMTLNACRMVPTFWAFGKRNIFCSGVRGVQYVFLCRKLIQYLLVCGWLCLTTRFIKH